MISVQKPCWLLKGKSVVGVSVWISATINIVYSFSDVSLDVYPELQFPTYGLAPLIDKSNKALEQVRLMYAKCNAIRNNIPVI